ncbi:uncharacterized protein [Taeniopygia guttata]|uniref:uncharacterized protein n=1 Tax=Taeniopygia guttata TaxID=59729 RepID=UPI003BB918D5
MDASGALASAPSSAAPSGSRSPMLPPGADREEWGPRFNCAPSTSAAASQAMPASGRKRKANFSNDETETLVWNVVRHFSALYGSEALRAHPVRRKQLWTQIQSRVNFLGYTERSIDDLKHKWRDLRLDVKKKITSKKHLPMNRAGGPLHKPRLTPLEKMVASTFLQASHDSEPEIILDPDLFFPGASKQPFMHLQPGVSHPSIYIDTNGQPSALPDVEGSAVPRLPGQSPDPAGGCEYGRGEGQGGSGTGESGPELRTPDASAISPSLRNESLVSYASMSEEEEREGREVERGHGGAAGMQPGPEAPMSAEEDMKLSRQAMLIRRCSSQGSVTSLPEDSLNAADAHSDWGHEGVSDLPALGRGLDSAHPEEQAGGPGPEMGALPRVLMGPTWEKAPAEEEPPARSPLHGALTEESLPSSASPPGDAPTAAGRGLGCSRLREDRRESWRTSIHHLLDLEEQWDQLYHQELAMWQEERATQREERARDRELQFRLLGVLTDIRDELRYLRQERAGARQSPAPPPPEPHRDPSPLLEQPKAEPNFPEPPAGSAGWADTAVPNRSPFGNRGRGRRRGRPRGSASRHRRLFLTNS